MIFDTRGSILPVLRHDFAVDRPIAVDTWRDGEYLGTGFFVDTSNPTVAFVTARHVADVPLKSYQRIGIGSIETNGIYWWDYFEHHKTADIAIAYIDRNSLPEWVKPLKIIPPDQTLFLGTEIVAFGFPLSEKCQKVDGKKEFRIVETCFRGHVAAIYDKGSFDGIEGAFSMNYALSFESPSGLSGAPLLLHCGDNLLVGGLIYKNKSTYFLIDQETTTNREGNLEKEISYRVYHFALAGGLKELADDRDFVRSTQPVTEEHG